MVYWFDWHSEIRFKDATVPLAECDFATLNNFNRGNKVGVIFYPHFYYTGAMISSDITSPSLYYKAMMSPAIKWAPGSCKTCQGSSNKTELFFPSMRLILGAERGHVEVKESVIVEGIP